MEHPIWLMSALEKEYVIHFSEGYMTAGCSLNGSPGEIVLNNSVESCLQLIAPCHVLLFFATCFNIQLIMTEIIKQFTAPQILPI